MQVLFFTHYFFHILTGFFMIKKVYTFVAIISQPQAVKVFSPGASSRKIHGEAMDGGAGAM
jgi:hypothetical protein